MEEKKNIHYITFKVSEKENELFNSLRISKSSFIKQAINYYVASLDSKTKYALFDNIDIKEHQKEEKENKNETQNTKNLTGFSVWKDS